MTRRFLHPARPAASCSAIFLLALAIRLVFGLVLHPPGDFLESDMWVYDLRAEHLRSGEYGKWDSFTPVGYPAFLAALYAVSGKSLAFVAAVQALLGAATAPLASLLALRITRDARVALASGLVVALHLPFILYGGLLLSETLFTFLLVLGAWLLLRAADDGRWTRAAAAGLALGAATVVRPNLLLFLPLVPVWAWFALRDRRAAFRLSARVLAATLPLLAAASLHNTRIMGKPAGLGTNGGLNFYLAHAEVQGIHFREDGFVHKIYPLPNLLRFEEPEVSEAPLYDEAHYYRKAFALLAAEPGRIVRSLRNVWMGFHQEGLHFWPGWRGWDHLLDGYGRLCFPLLLLPALAWLVRLGSSLRAQVHAGRLLLALLVGSTLVTLWLFLGDPRMRVPFDVFFAILTADAAVHAWGWARARLPQRRLAA